MFFVRSKEQIPCPCCNGELKVIGSRHRGYIDGTGAKIILIIRRLRCCNCERIHHELPDILVPYKRHSSESIEASIDGNSNLSAPADESTIRRWRYWFQTMCNYFSGCLLSIAIRYERKSAEEKTSLPSSKLQRIWQQVGDAPGWLARLVRPIANLNLWIHTRSAFLSG
ncbi:MAG TPA: DUF6431 domain-containing protein [Syntrophomonadaceae bacterium]|nr:DUF6431 domain-containing protein [Syntrophomonadaceae bacterium]